MKDFTLAGVYYGYPQCCIDFFNKRVSKLQFGLNGLDENQRKVHDHGFIPCPSCAKQVADGEKNLADLISNRICKTAFPNEGNHSDFLTYEIQLEAATAGNDTIAAFNQAKGYPVKQEEEPEWMSLSEIWERHGDRIMSMREAKSRLNYDLLNATSYFDKLRALKKFYASMQDEIMAAFRKSKHLWSSCYPTDWSLLFTPIEAEAWQSIRAKGHIVLYPQYPVGNYIIDFANPGLKIGLELDGKAFHNEHKDRARDAELQSMGWTIYRVKGSEMVRTDFKEHWEIEQDYYDEHLNESTVIEELSHWILNTGDGVIEAIKEKHFYPRTYKPVTEYAGERYRSLCEQTLLNHSY